MFSRAFSGDADYLLVRRFLVETYGLVGAGFNWDLRRWDGWRWYRADPGLPEDAGKIRLWFDGDRLVGVAHPAGRSQAYFEIHPDWRGLEAEMLGYAEESLGVGGELVVYAFEYDSPRIRLLEERGFVRTGEVGVTRRMRLGERSLAEPVLAGGVRDARVESGRIRLAGDRGSPEPELQQEHPQRGGVQGLRGELTRVPI